MSFTSKYDTFIFESYRYNQSSSTASFTYSFDGERRFTETVQFTAEQSYNEAVLDRALCMAWIIAGISYYKTFPTTNVLVKGRELTAKQAEFFSTVYLHGLSQFVYENNLAPENIAQFIATSDHTSEIEPYHGDGTLVLQSGGKDSLLLAELLKENNHDFSVWYMTQGTEYPAVLDMIQKPLRQITRTIDRAALTAAKNDGGLNGHIPVTYLTFSYALIDAILHGESTVLAAIGNEGEEPHAFIGDYPVTHQWSKTWGAEQLLAAYVSDHVAHELRVGSPLRNLSELKIAELFAQHAWGTYGSSFSSCNVANYKQGHDNATLSWCGECPKCANSYLLFAPWIDREELIQIFGKDMFADERLVDTFKGLLGVEDIEKPFECVGEIDELRSAYHLVIQNGYDGLPFEVPTSDFDRGSRREAQQWATQLIDTSVLQ